MFYILLVILINNHCIIIKIAQKHCCTCKLFLTSLRSVFIAFSESSHIALIIINYKFIYLFCLVNDLFGNMFNEFNFKYSHSWLTKTCSLIHQQTLHILKGKDLTVINSFKEDISLVF